MNHDGGFESDLEVLRELLQKYGFQRFENMVQIAGRSLYEPSISSSSRASVISSAATSISRTTSSGLSYYTDTSSLRSHPGSMSSWQQQMPALPVRSSNTSVTSRTSTPGESLTPDVPPLPDATTLAELDPDGSVDGSRTKLQCPFCTEYGIGQWIGRKPDLKRHFNKIHASNAQWTCKLGGGCNLTFDFHTAYDAHVKKEHGGVKDPGAKVNICQQVVWACGFETCREVFEAKTDDHGPKVMNNYFEHVLGHVVSTVCGRWSYTRRMRNLLHQELVRHAWKDCDKGPLDDDLVWQPQSSSILRKMLETRHINDAMLLCKYAVLLGSGHTAPALPPIQFSPPVLNTCKIVSPSHDPRHDARFSKGGLLSFRRSGPKPNTIRPSGRITGSQPKSKINVLRSPQPQHASLVPVSLMRSPPPVPPIPSSLRSPPPISGQHMHNVPSSSMMNMFATSGPQLQNLPSYTSPSEYNMGPSDSTTSLGYTDQPGLPTLDYNPLSLYSGYQSLGQPPSTHQFIGAKDDHSGRIDNGIQHNVTQHYAQKPTGNPGGDKQYRPRRNSSPGSDCRMGGESPVAGFSQPFLPGRHDQQGGRRRSSTTMDFVFAP
ncbi:hypothetical protein CONLIGDRAFT_218344 [Coniochaeta ligniaria NRRL 30616]|uniref:C2H2-type domain-containing protein n=1 Tax=Coniochaeta ligniaria NRRL 30616 TaxID=1408157 RepID=A0A1J7I4N0_9PEZI|nr:hypothetical protein CONLIGDRAFT_218344 [Coniochaeta ligniaria NRRL 30616]